MKRLMKVPLCLIMTAVVLTSCGKPAEVAETTSETEAKAAEVTTEVTTTEAATTEAVETTTEETTEETTEKTTEETTVVIMEDAADETQALVYPDIATLPAGTVLTEEDVEYYGVENCFTVNEIPEDVYNRMNGLTFKDYSPVSWDELRYIRCLHKDIYGTIMIGELVMHESVAYEICDIFHELYNASYPIEKMRLADDYGAEDLVSAADNNTSGFNVRYVEFTNVLCRHAYGMAIDINPLYNVYYLTDQDLALPEEGYDYVDRDWDFPYKITADDYCCQLFNSYGYTWGGDWYSPDYMHFEK